MGTERSRIINTNATNDTNGTNEMRKRTKHPEKKAFEHGIVGSTADTGR
jgi:hypothetical protein